MSPTVPRKAVNQSLGRRGGHSALKVSGFTKRRCLVTENLLPRVQHMVTLLDSPGRKGELPMVTRSRGRGVARHGDKDRPGACCFLPHQHITAVSE